jgi:metallo-beta-lactamase class B
VGRYVVQLPAVAGGLPDLHQLCVSFEDVVKQARPDIILSNHTIFDGSLAKFAALAARKPSDPHPFVVGQDSVQRYVKVAEECVRAQLLNFK